MKKKRLLILTFLLSLVFSFSGIRAFAMQAPSDSSDVIIEKLDSFMAELAKIESSLKGITIDENSDISEIENSYISIKGRLDVYYKRSPLIEDKPLLRKIYLKCDDLQRSIGKNIETINAQIKQSGEKTKVLIKLEQYDSTFKVMVIQGQEFCDKKNQEALDSLKQETTKLDLKLNQDANNKELIDSNEELKNLYKSIDSSKNTINNYKIAKPFDIWGLISKIAIVFAVVFFAVMIYNLFKSKKLMKAPAKKDNTPSI